MHRIRLRSILAGAGCLIATLLGGIWPASAQNFPSRPIQLLVPFAPGGPSDIAARAIAEALRGSLGQPVIVENKPGAGAVIATQALLSASADGHTLMMASNVVSTGKWLYKHLPFDPLKDLRAVIGVASSPHFVLVAPSFPGKDINDLIQAARQSPGKLNYASAGAGTMPHLAAELLKQRAGIDMQHIPYRGSGPALTDLLGGQVQLYIDIVLSGQSHVRGGTLKAIGVTTKMRLAEFPDIPTLDEQGVKDYEATSWFGIVTRADVPDESVTKLNAAINKALQTPEVRERLLSMGAMPIGGQPEAFQQMIEHDYHMWGEVISKAGITID